MRESEKEREKERGRERERYELISVHCLQSEASGGEVFTVKEGDIVVDTYFGVSALIHNSSNLGFFKRRGAVNW